MKSRRMPIALTIAGSDSGGGAGIQADLKTFNALSVHGTCAITCVTAQNPTGVRAIQQCSATIVRQQIEAVFDELTPAAVKTGMLFSRSIIETVARWFNDRPILPLIVDPVMVATSGARLLKPSAIRALRELLLPRACLVTPNVDEAEILAGRRVSSVEDLREVARTIQDRYGCSALVKGGHLRGLKEAVDIYYDGRIELLLSAPYIRNLSTHGTGCTYSAAVTASIARGRSLPKAVQLAKEYIAQAIAQHHRAGRHTILNSQGQVRI